MIPTIIISIEAWVLSFFLFVAMILFAWLGNTAGKRWRRSDDGKESEEKSGFGSLEAGLFGLFGFVLAITFAMSGNRYETHRNVLVQESNDIGTAILRADLYPDSIRQAFRIDFKEYVEARIAYYEAQADISKIMEARAQSDQLSSKIWDRATDMSKQPGMLVPSNQMIPALNAMIDITTTREAGLKATIPDIIIISLFILALIVTFVAGFSSPGIRKKDWMIIAGFDLLTSLIIYITLDIGRPRRGLINSDVGQEAIVELRRMF
ncbi:MAG: hypothetical protein ABIO46_15615 [Chitinophagales bacterium]